jgi:hypothetical protein
MKCKAMWHSRTTVKGDLRTIGLLVWSDRLMHFYPSPGKDAYARTFNMELEMALASMPPEAVWDYYTGRGNGVTSDWSEPIERSGVDEEEVASEMMSEQLQ